MEASLVSSGPREDRFETPKGSTKHVPVPLVGLGWQYSAMMPYTFGYTGLCIWTASLNMWYWYRWAGTVAPEWTVDVIFFSWNHNKCTSAVLFSCAFVVHATRSSSRFDLVASRSIPKLRVKTDINMRRIERRENPRKMDPEQKGTNRFRSRVRSRRSIGWKRGTKRGWGVGRRSPSSYDRATARRHCLR